MYDRLLTIERDVRLGWGRRVSAASALCWLMQLAALTYLWMYMAMIMTESCKVSMFASIVCMVSLTWTCSGQLLLSPAQSYWLNTPHVAGMILISSLMWLPRHFTPA